MSLVRARRSLNAYTSFTFLRAATWNRGLSDVCLTPVDSGAMLETEGNGSSVQVLPSKVPFTDTSVVQVGLQDFVPCFAPNIATGLSVQLVGWKTLRRINSSFPEAGSSGACLSLWYLSQRKRRLCDLENYLCTKCSMGCRHKKMFFFSRRFTGERTCAMTGISPLCF